MSHVSSESLDSNGKCSHCGQEIPHKRSDWDPTGKTAAQIRERAKYEKEGLHKAVVKSLSARIDAALKQDASRRYATLVDSGNERGNSISMKLSGKASQLVPNAVREAFKQLFSDLLDEDPETREAVFKQILAAAAGSAYELSFVALLKELVAGKHITSEVFALVMEGFWKSLPLEKRSVLKLIEQIDSNKQAYLDQQNQVYNQVLTSNPLKKQANTPRQPTQPNGKAAAKRSCPEPVPDEQPAVSKRRAAEAAVPELDMGVSQPPSSSVGMSRAATQLQLPSASKDLLLARKAARLNAGGTVAASPPPRDDAVTITTSGPSMAHNSLAALPTAPVANVLAVDSTLVPVAVHNTPIAAVQPAIQQPQVSQAAPRMPAASANLHLPPRVNVPQAFPVAATEEEKSVVDKMFEVSMLALYLLASCLPRLPAVRVVFGRGLHVV
jgi:hypothetical protein